MRKFQIGDKIKCVYADQTHNVYKTKLLTFGKIYEIVDVVRHDMVRIVLDNGRTDKMYIVCNNEVWFEKVEEEMDFLNILKGY